MDEVDMAQDAMERASRPRTSRASKVMERQVKVQMVSTGRIEMMPESRAKELERLSIVHIIEETASGAGPAEVR